MGGESTARVLTTSCLTLHVALPSTMRAMSSHISRVSGRAMSTTVNTTNPAPRYSGIPTFFRAPLVDMHQCTPEALDAVNVGIMGVPFDNGATNAPGARYGPRGVRTQSVNNVRRVNQATGAAPFDLGLTIADLGDAHVTRPFELVGAHEEIEAHMSKVLGAGITPLSVGGDHSVSLPLLRALAKHRAGLPPPGLVHIDAHCDTGDDYGGSRFHHGAPFKIAVDEGLIDPAKTLQIGIRGSLAFPEVWSFSSASGKLKTLPTPPPAAHHQRQRDKWGSQYHSISRGNHRNRRQYNHRHRRYLRAARHYGYSDRRVLRAWTARGP